MQLHRIISQEAGYHEKGSRTGRSGNRVSDSSCYPNCKPISITRSQASLQALKRGYIQRKFESTLSLQNPNRWQTLRVLQRRWPGPRRAISAGKREIASDQIREVGQSWPQFPHNPSRNTSEHVYYVPSYSIRWTFARMGALIAKRSCRCVCFTRLDTGAALFALTHLPDR